MAKPLDINPKAERQAATTEAGVGALSRLDQLEGMMKQMAQQLAICQQIIVNEIGAQGNGRLFKLLQNNYNIGIGNSGDLVALIKKLELDVDELKEIRRVEFDEPLEAKQEAFEKEMQERLKKEQTRTRAEALGMSVPEEKKIIV